jgi:hypothetical protein
MQFKYHFKNKKTNDEIAISARTNAFLTFSLVGKQVDAMEFKMFDEPDKKTVLQTKRVIDVVQELVRIIETRPEVFNINEFYLLNKFLLANQTEDIELFKTETSNPF